VSSVVLHPNINLKDSLQELFTTTSFHETHCTTSPLQTYPQPTTPKTSSPSLIQPQVIAMISARRFLGYDYEYENYQERDRDLSTRATKGASLAIVTIIFSILGSIVLFFIITGTLEYFWRKKLRQLQSSHEPARRRQLRKAYKHAQQFERIMSPVHVARHRNGDVV
jgi:hypothetical protein